MKRSEQRKVVQLRSLGQLEAQVSQLHTFRTQLKAISEQERALTQTVVKKMQHQGLTQVDNCTMRGILVESKRLSIHPQAFSNRVSNREFMSCVSISTSKARKVMGEQELRRISDFTTSYSIRLAEIKKASRSAKSQAA